MNLHLKIADKLDSIENILFAYLFGSCSKNEQTKKSVDITILNKDGIVLKDNELRTDFELIKQHDILDYKAFRNYIDAA